MTETFTSSAPTGRFSAGLCTYLGALVIGLTLVSFPASSLVLRTAHGFSNEQYGAIYIPQLATSVVGALVGGAVARRLSLKAMFLFALACFTLAELLLSFSIFVAPTPALAMIMVATGAFGFGFGFGGGPLNAFAALLFPERQGAAVTAVHMCAGAGLTIAPVYFAVLANHGAWIVGPGSCALVSAVLFFIALPTRFPLPVADNAASGAAPARHPGVTLFFWICALAALLYSVAEGTFSNWAIVFLTEERGLDAGNAALALTCFWAALTVGRLIATVIATRVPPAVFLLALPLGMTASLLFLPNVASVDTAYLGFALAGLSCSAFFPMLVAFTAQQSPAAISWIASMLTAAMMVGVGIGSYAVGALRSGMPIASLYGQAIIAPLLCLLCIGAAFGLFRRRRSPA